MTEAPFTSALSLLMILFILVFSGMAISSFIKKKKKALSPMAPVPLSENEPLPGKVPAAVPETIKTDDPPLCSTLHHCTTEQRLSCEAFSRRVNCCAVRETPCCDRDECGDCPFLSVIQKGTGGRAVPREKTQAPEKRSGFNLCRSHMAVMKEISAAFSVLDTIEDIGAAFFEKMGKTLLCERGAIYMADLDKSTLSLTAAYRWADIPENQVKLSFSPLLNKWVGENKFPMTVTDAERDEQWRKFFSTEREKNMFRMFDLLYPIANDRGTLMGFVLFGKKQSGEPYSADELNLIAYASITIGLSFKRAKTQDLSILDALTGLCTEKYLRESLQELLSAPDAETQVCSLVIMDIDSDRRDNEAARQSGIAMREIARLLKEKLRGDDLAARCGDQEIAVMLPGATKEQAYDIAERIRKLIERTTFQAFSSSFTMTVSLGIATFPADAVQPEELMRKAGEALNEAHRTGRNMTCSA